MKITTALLLMFTITQATASEYMKHIGYSSLYFENESIYISAPVKKLQDRDEVAFNSMMSELARVHREVFKLPYEYEYIKNTLMATIEANRKIIAPHYPSREVTGDDQALIMETFKVWYKTYPQESYEYIVYVDSFIAEHSK